MKPETRITLANLDGFAAGRVLCVGFGSAELAHAVTGTVRLLEQSYAAWRHLHAAGVDASFLPWIAGETATTDTVLIHLPKEAERFRLLIAMARALCVPGGSILVAGHNDAGIRSAPRHLGDAGLEAETIDYRYHCRLVRAIVAEPVPFDPAEWRTRLATRVAGRAMTIVGYPGVFAHGRVDPATEMLLDEIRIDEGARILDVGCGSGIIGARIAAEHPDVKIHMVDADAMALLAAGQTARANGLADRLNIWASDVFSDVADHDYSLIVSNPPFHTGVQTATDVAARLITEAPDHLARGGELWIVANRFLDYPRHLERAFGRFDVARETNKYRVYRARKH